LDRSLGELVELIVLHALEGALPFNEKTRQAIADLKRVYDMDYDLNTISRFVENTTTWQRFTERARRVVFFAQEEAARLGENWVGTEHLLLGLVRESDSVASRILAEKLGVALDRIRSEIVKQVTPGPGNLGRDMQLTPRTKCVIDLANEEANALKNDYIGTEHLLLGLLREEEGLAAQVLRKLGADMENARAAVRGMQAG
jgi:ATP-dependent Clp protease ATP-binding subunit ClpC